MDTFSYLLVFSQVVLFVVIFLAWTWLKKLPDAVHKRSEQSFQHELNLKLEALKNSLGKDLELMKISQSQIQIRKIERFMDFAKIQTEILTNESFKEKVIRNDSKTISKLRETVVELGIGLYFFASDDTIRKYAEWKLGTAKGGEDPYRILSLLGELMVSLRKDVGYQETELNGTDYLKLFVTDWDETQSRIRA